jgi:hypothetical protein
MQHAALLAVVAAAAMVSATGASVSVSAHVDVEIVFSKTYKAKVPVHDTYNCDATAPKCYAPKSHGNDYKPKEYSYGRKYPYPGPKERFCNKLKSIGKAIAGVFKKIFKGFKRAWTHFKDEWNEWCAIAKSDWQRFEDWKTCQADKWKKWWEYHHDLCKTRKQLWDDAMREFHRQWTHYRHTRREEYEASKKKCGITDKDYDEKPKYAEKINKYGVTPIEDQYKQYSSGKGGAKYDPAAYKKHCDERDAKYKAANGGSLGDVPGTVPVPEPVKN